MYRDGQDVVVRGDFRRDAQLLLPIRVHPGPDRNLHADIEEERGQPKHVARRPDERKEGFAIGLHEHDAGKRTDHPREHPDELVHVGEEPSRHGERHGRQHGRTDHMADAAAQGSLLRVRLHVGMDRMAQEVEPDRQEQQAEADIRYAYPHEFVVDDALEDRRLHCEALLHRGGIEVREDDLLREEYADDRADGIDRLRQVEPPYGASGVADRQNARIGRRLQDRAAAGDDEYADEVDVEALVQAGRNVQERADHVCSKSDQNARAERKLLDKNRRKKRKDGIGPVERHLHQHGAVLVHGKDALERRHEVVGHVVHDAPEREVQEQKRHCQDGVFSHARPTFGRT